MLGFCLGCPEEKTLVGGLDSAVGRDFDFCPGEEVGEDFSVPSEMKEDGRLVDVEDRASDFGGPLVTGFVGGEGAGEEGLSGSFLERDSVTAVFDEF